MTVRAAIYLRMSKDRLHDLQGIDRQRSECLAIAAKRGWTPVKEYTDNNFSASRKEVHRPGYEQMLADFQDGRFDAVICWDLDRLTRQPRQLEDWIDHAEKSQLQLVTANGEADLGTPMGRTWARVKAAIARNEMEQKGARQRVANIQRAQQGKPPAGVRLTGYEFDGTLIESEATAVRAAFESFLAGESLKGIARSLTLAGVPIRRPSSRNQGRWSASTVLGILKNARYAGFSVRLGEIVTGEDGAQIAGRWEPLISEAVFAAVQGKLHDPARRSNRSGSTERRHLGSGLYLCGVCGEPLTTNSQCYWCRKGGHVSRSMAVIDAFVQEMIAARLREPDILAHVPTEGASDELRALSDRSRDLRAKLARHEADYLDDLIDGQTLKRAKDRVTDELHDIDLEVVRLSAGTTMSELLGQSNPAEVFLGASLMHRRAIINALATVTLHPRTKAGGKQPKQFDPASVTIAWRHA